MKSQNLHRDRSAERLVDRSSGPLHAIIPEGVKPEKRSGPVPYGDPDAAKICLQCPYPECLLDDPDRYCTRFEKEMQKIRRQRKENEGL